VNAVLGGPGTGGAVVLGQVAGLQKMETTHEHGGGNGSGTGKYLGRKAVAERFGVTERTIDNWRKHYGLQQHWAGGRVVFIAGEVEAWVQSRNGARARGEAVKGLMGKR
jgi:hypothetical protein